MGRLSGRSGAHTRSDCHLGPGHDLPWPLLPSALRGHFRAYPAGARGHRRGHVTDFTMGPTSLDRFLKTCAAHALLVTVYVVVYDSGLSAYGIDQFLQTKTITPVIALNPRRGEPRLPPVPRPRSTSMGYCSVPSGYPCVATAWVLGDTTSMTAASMTIVSSSVPRSAQGVCSSAHIRRSVPGRCCVSPRPRWDP
jgi:hypothetical protein